MARGSSQRKRQSVTDKEKSKKPQNGQPKSMVIRIGAQEVGSSVSQLVQDVRHVMEPDTAVRLKVCVHVPLYDMILIACAGAKG
jgi:ribosome biogenesis protein SSF1/2